MQLRAFQRATRTIKTVCASSLQSATRSVKMSSQRAHGADPRATRVLAYWFEEDWATAGKCWLEETAKKIPPRKWFSGAATVDKEIIDQFSSLHSEMAAGSLDAWLEHPANALAGVILMDQFSRNMFRGSPQSFALDGKALAWAKHILDTKICDDFPLPQRIFLYLPFEHTESADEQERAVTLCRGFLEEGKAAAAAGDPDAPDFVKIMAGGLQAATFHQQVILKWGRFPHRNAILGRESTPEEIAGLADGSIKQF